MKFNQYVVVHLNGDEMYAHEWDTEQEALESLTCYRNMGQKVLLISLDAAGEFVIERG